MTYFSIGQRILFGLTLLSTWHGLWVQTLASDRDKPQISIEKKYVLSPQGAALFGGERPKSDEEKW